MKLKEVLNYLTSQMVVVVKAAVKSLQNSTYKIKGKVNISNFPKTQRIKGSITVANQKKVEAQLIKLTKAIKQVEASISKIPKVDKVEVSNIKDTPLQKILKFPESFKVSNPQEKVEVINLKDVKTWLKKVEDSNFQSLSLYHQVNHHNALRQAQLDMAESLSPDCYDLG